MSCGPATNGRAVEFWCRNVPACPRCTLASTSPPHWRNWGLSGPLVPGYVPPPKPAKPRPAAAAHPLPVVLPPCGHEGEIVERCKAACGKAEGRHVRDCAHPDNPTETCTRDHPKTRVWNCATCPHHTAFASPLPPLAVAEVGPAGLARTRDRGAFNGGEVEFAGRRFLAYRVGLHGSRVRVAELDAAGAVTRDVRLDLPHPEAADGQEDPVPFVFAGQLHVAFVGVWKRGRDVATSQLYARLAGDLTVEAVYAPRYARRAYPKEKNWGFFEGPDGNLYAAYSISPHAVLRIDGDRAEKVYESPYPFPWSGGHLRGGAAPVLVGDRFYHWTHGRLDRDRLPLYSVGVYTFAAAPPFRPLAAAAAPLLWGDDAEAKRLKCPYSVVFPRGAVLRNGAWEVTGGEYDTRLARWTWDAAVVDRLLAAAPGNRPVV